MSLWEGWMHSPFRILSHACSFSSDGKRNNNHKTEYCKLSKSLDRACEGCRGESRACRGQRQGIKKTERSWLKEALERITRLRSVHTLSRGNVYEALIDIQKYRGILSSSLSTSSGFRTGCLQQARKGFEGEQINSNIFLLHASFFFGKNKCSYFPQGFQFIYTYRYN